MRAECVPNRWVTCDEERVLVQVLVAVELAELGFGRVRWVKREARVA
jgi:hypothetical protein